MNENLLSVFPNLVILVPTHSEGPPRLGLVQDSCDKARSCRRRDKDARPQVTGATLGITHGLGRREHEGVHA
jgi:hypothetical protein